MTNPPPYPGGQQPHDPYLTGQPYQQGQPYQPGQPAGQSPHPAYPAGGFTPPPKKSSLKWLWILLGVFGVIGVLIVAGAITLAVLTKDNVTDSDDLGVGDCATLAEKSSDDVRATKVECSSTDFHFVVAQKVQTRGTCGDYFEYYFYRESKGSDSGQEGDVLCLAPVYQEGKCYQEADSSAGTFYETVEVSCTSPTTKPGYTNVRIDSKVDGTATCPAGQGALNFDEPTPVGYCVSLLE